MIPLPNTQPVEKQELREDGALDIVSCFQTIQGEGPLAGTPAVFVRLAGCNFQCEGCDTNYTGDRAIYLVDELFSLVNCVKSPGTSLVVLTGGEPFRQNITPFVNKLLWADTPWHVQIETNGALALDRFPYDDSHGSIVCSPKTHIHNKISWYASAFKYILQHGQVDAEDGLPIKTLGTYKPDRPGERYKYGKQEIFVQPMDEQDQGKNDLNLKACIDSCLKFGYRLSLQTHKITHMP